MYVVKEGQLYDLSPVPTQGGIDFDSIVSRIRAGEETGEFNGLSGKNLRYTMYEERHSKGLHIADLDDPRSGCHLSASLFPLNTLHLSVKTKYNAPQIGRHPDMYAGEFVGNALGLFAYMGIRVKKFQALWFPAGDNYKSFVEGYKSLGKAQAARATWSGRTVAEYGFTEIAEKDVQINDDGFIEATFHRK